MPKEILYDQACYNLAEHFFRGHPLGTDENVIRLARHIQSEVESEIAQIERDGDQ